MSPEVIEYLPPQELVVRPQVRRRVDEAADAEMKQSLKTLGMLQPILARMENNKPVIIFGHRRAAMAIALGMPRVPVMFESRELSVADILHRQLVENCQRAELSPLDRASAIQELMEKTGWSAAQVAEKLDLSPGAVSKSLPLLSLPKPIIELIEAGKIAASAGYELSRVNDPAKQAELAQQLAAGELTRDALAGARKAARKRPTTRTQKQAARVTAILSENRSVTVASAGLTLDRFIELIEELLTKARRVRTQGVELATFIKMLKDQARAG